jgi:iron complex outermembrane receptor protein
MLTVLLLLMSLLSGIAASQPDSISFLLTDAETGEPLPGATVYIPELERGRSADTSGLISFEALPAGTYTFEFSFVGYESRQERITLPDARTRPVAIALEHAHEALEEVTVSTTRTSRTIEDSPTRVEAITIEEIGEKANMRPGDIRMLLAESTGIQVQQSSAVSGSSNFRIQGLGGRYTQMLKDGFPLYGGFSGGLSIMQIPPLDLRQVEVIKGSNSTLYGGGAIAGLVNLLTKRPSETPELSLLANASTTNNLDFSSFYRNTIGPAGLTLFAAYNRNTGYDPSDQGFTAEPKYDRFTLNPKLFYTTTNGTEYMAAAQFTLEDRLGGDIRAIKDEDRDGRYVEEHDTRRLSTQFSMKRVLTADTRLTLKNSFSFLNRSITLPDFLFEGRQISSFSEIALNHESGSGTWSAGLNLWTDRFEEEAGNSPESQDQHSAITGAFIQNTSALTEELSLEAGLRTDLVRPALDHAHSGLFVLPRVAALYRFNSSWSMRFGGGMGYKIPEMFIDEAQNRGFRNVATPAFSDTKAEQSYGLNYDVNYRTLLGDETAFRINQLFFATRLEDPLMLEEQGDNRFRITNMPGHIQSSGSETNLSLIRKPAKLFLGYTFVHARQHQGADSRQVPLNSPHQINAVLMFEKHGSYRLGFEGYYYSEQRLSNGETGRGYTIFGIMSEKSWGMVTIFANLENIFDTRQTRFGPIYDGSRQNPQFRDIYAPLQGRYFNMGLKLQL